MADTCTVADCSRTVYARTLCGMHYKRLLRHGDAQADIAPRGTRRPCCVGGCGNDAEGRGLCHGHLQRLLRSGDVAPDVPLGRRRQADACEVASCGREPYAKGLCQAHYRRLTNDGDPRADVPINSPAGEGWISHGYRYLVVPMELRHLTNGESQAAEHRLRMAMHLGRALLPDESVHHRNGDRRDNRLANLELWSTAHPKGQRVADKLAFAVQFLLAYAPGLLTIGDEPEQRRSGHPEE